MYQHSLISHFSNQGRFPIPVRPLDITEQFGTDIEEEAWKLGLYFTLFGTSLFCLGVPVQTEKEDLRRKRKKLPSSSALDKALWPSRNRIDSLAAKALN